MTIIMSLRHKVWFLTVPALLCVRRQNLPSQINVLWCVIAPRSRSHSLAITLHLQSLYHLSYSILITIGPAIAQLIHKVSQFIATTPWNSFLLLWRRLLYSPLHRHGTAIRAVQNTSMNCALQEIASWWRTQAWWKMACRRRGNPKTCTSGMSIHPQIFVGPRLKR